MRGVRLTHFGAPPPSVPSGKGSLLCKRYRKMQNHSRLPPQSAADPLRVLAGSKPPRFAPSGWEKFSFGRENFFPPELSGPIDSYNSCEAGLGKTRPGIPNKVPGGAPTRARARLCRTRRRVELFRRGPRRGKKFFLVSVFLT